MTTSEVDIVNNALFEIGDSPIASLAEATKRARICATVYPQKRDALLMTYRWTFATGRATLMPDVAAPDFGFTYQFQLPADCLSVIGLYDGSEDLRNYTATKDTFKVEGRKLLFTDSTVRIFYVRRVTNVTLFDPLFTEALIYSTAHRLAYALSTGQGRLGELTRSFEQALRRAKMQNAIQSTPEIIEADEYLSSRYSDLGGDEFLRAGPIVT